MVSLISSTDGPESRKAQLVKMVAAVTSTTPKTVVSRRFRFMPSASSGGGRVAILEFSEPTWQPFKWIYSNYFRHLLPRVGQLMAKNRSAYEYLPQSVAEFPSGDALAARMREAGLRDVWQRTFTCGIVTLYVGTR